MGRVFALTVCILAAFALFYSDARTPAPAPADAPADSFSAGRAMVDDAAMAQIPHPLGSLANAAVRDYLMRRMAGLGLSPQIQTAQSQRVLAGGGKRHFAGSIVEGGDVHNVIGVLPGRSTELPALVLMAHYDSVPGSPGAADDIAGVSAALEIVRAIEAKGMPERDVIVLMTEGEEAGLLGAQAFFDQSPLAPHAGFVINLESRGGGGRAVMFQTGPDNGQVVDLYRHTAISPVSNSLTDFIYQILPNDTDFSVSLEKHLPGLNYAFIGRQFDYHSPSSTVAALDRGAVQSLGDQALGPARTIAFATVLPAAAPSAVYGTLPGGLLVAYPAWAGWLILLVVAGLIAVSAMAARRHEPLRIVDVAKGAGGGLLLIAAGAVVFHLVRHATGQSFGWIGGRGLLARFPHYEIAMAFAGLAVIGFVIAGLSRGDTGVRGAVMSLLAGLAASLFGGFDLFGLELGAVSAVLAFLLLRHPAHRAASWIGLMLLTLAGAVVLQAMQPQASLILVWPLAAAAACAALTGAGTAEGPLGGIGRVLAFLITILGLAWVGGFFHTLLQGLDVPEALGAVLLLAALLLWPIAWRADPHDRPWITASDTLLVVALCMALWEHWTSPWSARHPRADMPLYVVDQTGGGAYRFSPFKPDRWVASILKADGGSIVRRAFPGISANGGPREGWAAPARAAGAPPVVISVIRGRDGVVTIKAPVPADGRLDLQLRTSAEVSDARIDGRPAAILAKAGDWTRMVWQAAPEGVSVSFKPAAPGAVEIRYAEWIPAWPAGAAPLPAPPRNAMAWSYAGATVVTGAQKVAW
jgi:hypothetical protein